MERVIRARLRPPGPSGLSRSRLLDPVPRLWHHRLGLVIGPAGAGKTTLLAQIAAGTEAAVAWYRADGDDASRSGLLCHLVHALREALPDLDPHARDVPGVVTALEACQPRTSVLLIDDLHTLDDTDAMRCLGELLACRPPWLAVLAAARRSPTGLSLSRLRVTGEVLLLGRDDLRFRAWEVEELFRDVYREPMAPEDAARLTRRTGGWAAGLQLFHLATRGRSAAERHDAIRSLETVPRLTRSYLAREVLEKLPDELRSFLVHSSVLGRLDGPLCDALLDRTGSAAVLAELERRELFVAAEGSSYRYHEALRQHLEVALVDQVGEAGARARHQRAGRLLLAAGAVPEALLAFCRGEDWPAVDRLLGAEGPRLTGGATAWLERVPASLRDHDPWLLLAAARTQVAAGHLAAARQTYRRAEAAFGATSRAGICVRERTLLSAWLEPFPSPSRDWSGMLRAATRQAPRDVPAAALRDGVDHDLLTAACLLLAGDVRGSRRHSAPLLEDPTAEPVLHAVARLVTGVAGWLAGDARAAEEVTRAAEACTRLDLNALARLGRILLVQNGEAGGTARALRSWQREDDGWAFALATLLRALTHPDTGVDDPVLLETATDLFRRLGAPVLEAWSGALSALLYAAAGHPRAEGALEDAEQAARTAAAPGPDALLLLARAHHEPDRAATLLARARAVAGPLGLSLDCFPGPDVPGDTCPPPGGGRPTEVELRCLGGFNLWISGRCLVLGEVRPQARTILQILALQAGRAVHRERLITALWPDVGPERGVHRLHVAVSSLRGLLGSAGGSVTLDRHDDSYRLSLPGTADVDLWTYQNAQHRAEWARTAGRPEAETAALRRLRESYGGELLPEAGPADWIAAPRRRYRSGAVGAAARLAVLALEADRPAEAAEVCEWGLRVDRYSDGLWRLAIEAHERTGATATAGRLRARYQGMLEELGTDLTDRDLSEVLARGW